MCGINGIIGIDNTSEAKKVIEVMNRAIAHRGPDDSGVYVESGIALGQNRLSIIDLTSAGHQPMYSMDGNLVLVFNGEIYNYKELKQELREYSFQTHTDSEVILAAYMRWGYECVHRFNGMFAFAIWDIRKQDLFIGRDRLGVKPLYYYRHNELFLFSSEVRALLKSNFVPKKLNHEGLIDYLRYQTVHAPATIVKNVHMLLPGHTMLVKRGQVEITRYWSPEENAVNDAGNKSYEEIKQDIFNLLQKSVERRLVADVPFGAFLSGGIDSSIIVGLMSQVASQQVKTFSVTFEEEEFSEAKYAAIIAKKFKTEHHDIRLKPDDFLQLIPTALNAMDHPSGDGPNTFVVSKVTREAGITMALSGLGGDEVFAGYDVFKRMYALQHYKWLASLPLFLRKAVGQSLTRFKPSVASDKIQQLLYLPSWSLQDTYPITRQVLSESYIKELTGMSILPENHVRLVVRESMSQQYKAGVKLPLLSQVSAAEMRTYMQNTLLRDTDQMSMAHALEVRVPFLDYELVEYVMGVSDKYKYPHTPKKLLTDAVGDLLPPEIINRPKMGFTLPWKEWLKNELYSFCETKLHNMAARDLFVKDEVLTIWRNFLKREPQVTWAKVWYLVVLENWLEENGVA
ncbi:asparagine synthase (glutamine-hydrolyzing) [Pontibacter fetidus]|uniref:asparagine synthase (glutamine-hydrolyzing) n=1 Tax=Pontibacter fetidus TaxID=2700082 RepID=A0A6B2H2I1_9BACT|nr:asparagine synthase (glutamine-hydrolyzing) [Pontibacter fetidus]NDK54517.1 asparagine synthase (glutamine-hydrolyzing) [Pontibacter fetidus]